MSNQNSRRNNNGPFYNRNNSRSNNNNSNSHSNNHNNYINNLNLSYDERALILMYQGFYDNISRQMSELYRAQDEIRNNINSIIRNSASGSASSGPRSSYGSERASGLGSNSSTLNNSRIYIDGQPYILEYQHQYIPYNQTNNWSDSSYNYSSHHYADPSGNTGESTGYNSALNFLQQFYSNVPVFPSNEQITDGTLVGPFCQMVSPVNNSCPISLEPFDINTIVTQIRGCGHVFHNDSIRAWFATNPRCPVCRYDIRDYVPYVRPSTNASVPSDMSGNPIEENLPDTNNGEQSESTSIPPPQTRSQNRNEERNINRTRNRSSSSRPLSTTANLTGLILSQLISSATRNSIIPDTTQYTYDSSNNEIILEGFLRGFD
jgi:hypothetical protein